MTTQGDFESRTRNVMVELWGVERERLTPETKLGKDLGVDSLDLVELVMSLEDEFCVAIPDEAIEGGLCDQSVGDVFAALSRYVVAQAA